MILKNGLVVDENFKLKKLDVEVKEEKITAISENLNGDRIDLNGKYLLPGFIDTHMHGAAGVDIKCENPDFCKMQKFEASQGVTSIAVATLCYEFESILKQFDAIREASKNICGAKIAAIHAEGPFLNKAKKGSMNEKNILSPDIKKLDEMIERGGGLLKIITVAPEVEKASELIHYAVDKGITVSMGHTMATFEQANSAILAGVSQATHVFNAMREYNHREPGVLGAALTNHDVLCELICDYVHVHPATVKMVYELKGADRINIISDSDIVAGTDVTEFELDGEMRYVRDGCCRLSDGTITGSTGTMLTGVKNLLKDGIDICDVSKMASFNPAKTLGIEKSTGSIALGKFADLTVLDKNFDVVYTFVNGKCIFKR